MSAEAGRARAGGPLSVAPQPPPDRSLIDAVSGFINDVKLSAPAADPKDVIQWARFETADINEPSPEGDSDNDSPPLLLILGYGTGVQVWLIPPAGDAQEVLSWRQGSVRVLRILPTPHSGDCFAAKRPLIALCDSASPGPAFCSLSFISIRGGEQVKSIKFKNPILDVLANKRSVVVSFSERFAVFDAGSLEDRMAVTTCYPCPCPLGGSAPVNPLALGDRWLAYADRKLNPSKRSSGGCEGEGQTSYTATVLHAAKSLSKGLRGLGETVAQSLAGTRASQSPSPPHSDALQPGVVTIIDIEGIDEEDGQDAEEPCDPLVAHFVAHSDAIIALKFDASGMVLVTADRRGHDFHVFRINPHPCGPALAAVHHLYILHRGDTTAKVQDIAISGSCRWAAVSTLRGTTHVFALCPYGGAAGVRTHTAPRLVNRLSRFHRSAGLPPQATHKRASPVCDGVGTGAWFPNPRLPPYPLPTVSSPLAQLRPTANLATHTITRTSSGRQRLSSLSEDNTAAPLLARAAWGAAVGAGAGRGASHALYLMTASGSLMHLLLHPKPASSVPKEKICDDSPIELEVEQVAQWPLQRPPAAADLLAPLPPSNPLLQPLECRRCVDMCATEEERWLAQVEIVTHAGPHRRLWMGPQFVFKTYNCTGSNSSLSEAETVDVDTSAARGVARSNPVNMPSVRPIVPILIDSGSASSLEHSPSDSFRRKSLLAESGRAASVCDVQLREDLAEAMKEDHGWKRWEPAGGSGAAPGPVQLAVAPGGTVVRAVAGTAPPAADPDDYTQENSDEATFRPVVRAPARLPHHLPASPLPHTTTIPVQSLPSRDGSVSDPSPDAAPLAPPEYLIEREMEDARRETPIAQIYPTAKHDDSSDLSDKFCEATEVDQKNTRVAAESLPQPAVINRIRECAEVNDMRAPTVPTKQEEIESPMLKQLGMPSSERKEESLSFPTPKENTPKEIKVENIAKSKAEDTKPAKDRKDSRKSKASSEGRTSAKQDHKKETTEMKSSLREEKAGSKDLRSESKVSTKEASSKTKSKETTPESKYSVKESKYDSKTQSVSVKTETKMSIKEVSENQDVTEAVTTRTDRRKKEAVDNTNDVRDTEEVKQSGKKKLEESTSKQKEVITESIPSQELTSSKLSLEKNLQNAASAIKKEIDDPELIEYPRLTTYSKENSSERESSPRKERRETKNAWAKNSSKMDWSAKTESQDLITSQKDTDSCKSLRLEEIQIKTEEQAWDMLLNEPEKQVMSVSPQSVASDKSDESKSKSKKNRKIKKSQDDPQNKSEDDSFVEIHAIDKTQLSSGDLVSISLPFEEIESACSFSSKHKKSRSPKLSTEKDHSQTKIDDWSLETIDYQLKSSNRKKSSASDIEIVVDYDALNKPKDFNIETEGFDTINTECVLSSEVSREKKYKSSTPSQENRLLVDTDVKDVYVIDSTKDEFPEIKITSSRGSKLRKKSPQVDKGGNLGDAESVPEKPIKSWSSIAASKHSKKSEEEIAVTPERKMEQTTFEEINEEYKVASRKISKYEQEEEPLSLHEELMRLCKRTDIMVAQCDAPSGLSFVDEHHTSLHDFPPLEIDFGLDDFRLEVMRDSLLESNDRKLSSPICKIDIDSILSSIKESTSAFNLIDLEKVPDRKEKGFSVVQNDKISSQEVKADDEARGSETAEVMEKSSDDEVASPATDSDKDDKKIAGAAAATPPSNKQSSKSKKSRRKKK